MSSSKHPLWRNTRLNPDVAVALWDGSTPVADVAPHNSWWRHGTVWTAFAVMATLLLVAGVRADTHRDAHSCPRAEAVAGLC